MKHHKEDERKGHDEEKGKKQQVGEGVKDATKHDGVDRDDGNIGRHKYQVQPRKEDASDANLPLPRVRTPTVVYEDENNEDDCHHIQDPLDVVLDVKEVVE